MTRAIIPVDGCKPCSTCKVVKPVSEFWRSSKNASGFKTDCKDCRKIKSAVYRIVNRESILIKQRERRAASPEKDRAAKNKWRDNNREHQARLVKKWLEKNRDAKLSHTRNYRARIRMAGGAHNKADIEFLRVQQNGCCANCKQHSEKLDVDHIFPIKLGGTNDRLNLQLLCPTCNKRKSAKRPEVFAKENGRLI